jgi:hypothetical protein
VGHPDDRKAVKVIAVLIAWAVIGVALVVAALVLVRWLGSHIQLIWRYSPARRAAVTATATVVRPLPAAVPNYPSPRG